MNPDEPEKIVGMLEGGQVVELERYRSRSSMGRGLVLASLFFLVVTIVVFFTRLIFIGIGD